MTTGRGSGAATGADGSGTPTAHERTLDGVGASGGIGIGPGVVLRPPEAVAHGDGRGLDEAVAVVVAHYAELAERAAADGRDDEAEVLEAYEMLVTDRSLHGGIRRRNDDGMALDEAAMDAGHEEAEQLAALGDAYLAQRAEDLRAAVRDLVTAIRGGELRGDVELGDGAVVVADELTPADTAAFDLARVGGFVTARGGTTSHVAIVARSHGIPAVVGATGLLDTVADGDRLVVDGDAGTVVVAPSDATVAQAEQRADARRERRAAAGRLKGTAVHFDGERVLVAANIGTRGELDAAKDAEADGIGLLRTEFLFLDATEPPSREAQAELYRAAAEAFTDPVVVRTLDIGGDKDVAWLDTPDEDNPFLGVRGIRLSLEHLDLLRTQFEALLDAGRAAGTHAGSTAGAPGLWVMLPMVAAVDDVRRARAVWEAAVAAGDGAGRPSFGIMVETPAAALLAPHLVAEVDFVSIGTNDLSQYTTAADRGLASLASLHDPCQPSVLRLVAMTADAARAADTPVAVCGGAAADPVAAAVLLGLGVRELSVPPNEVDVVRAVIDGIDASQVQRLARAALDLPDADAVRELVTDTVAGLV